jgi:hypothetical protein
MADEQPGEPSQDSRNPQQKPTNLVGIDQSWRFCDEGCQYCESFAPPVQCAACDLLGCDECLWTVNGKRLCTTCKEDEEGIVPPTAISLSEVGEFVVRRPAKILMFPVGSLFL